MLFELFNRISYGIRIWKVLAFTNICVTTFHYKQMAKITKIKIPIQMGMGNEKTERKEMELR